MLGASAWGPMTSSVIFIHCSGRPLSTGCLAPHATQPTPLPAAACRRLGPSSPRTACASHSRRGPPKPIDNSSSQDFQQLILQATQAHQSAFATASALSLGINLSGTLFQPGKRGRGASRAKITEGATSSSSPFQDDPAATKAIRESTSIRQRLDPTGNRHQVSKSPSIRRHIHTWDSQLLQATSRTGRQRTPRTTLQQQRLANALSANVLIRPQQASSRQIDIPFAAAAGDEQNWTTQNPSLIDSHPSHLPISPLELGKSEKSTSVLSGTDNSGTILGKCLWPSHLEPNNSQKTIQVDSHGRPVTSLFLLDGARLRVTSKDTRITRITHSSICTARGDPKQSSETCVSRHHHGRCSKCTFQASRHSSPGQDARTAQFQRAHQRPERSR